MGEKALNILAIDSSGLVATVALIRDDILVGEYSIHNKLTHSQTLLPMIEQIMSTSGTDKSELDAVAISKGPGSFTGLRIGAATAKGLAQALEIKIIPVSSLLGLAYNLTGVSGIICPIMDARRNQVYYGIYDGSDGAKKDNIPAALCDEAAEDIDAVLNRLRNLIDERGEGTAVTFAGDGVAVYEQRISEVLGERAKFADITQRYQRAASVAAIAKEYFNNMAVEADVFTPTYLRVSQAERERAERLHLGA